jgi:hypothetical protein
MAGNRKFMNRKWTGRIDPAFMLAMAVTVLPPVVVEPPKCQLFFVC